LPLIEANGLKFHVQQVGSGPRIALIHGLTANLASWYLSVALHLAASFRVLMYDQRGHGLSQVATEGFNLGTLSRDLFTILQSVIGETPEPIHVAGHSHGGALALRFAIDYPEWVRKVVVVDAPMPPFDHAEVEELMGIDLEEVLDSLPKEQRKRMEESRIMNRKANRAIHFTHHTTFRRDLEIEPDFSSDLSSIEQPVLCLYGNDSIFLPAGQSIASHVAHGQLDVLPGNHYLPWQQTTEIARRMKEFCYG
jgi:pimeloyl-ACP methyl ester carboxylesterase